MSAQFFELLDNLDACVFTGEALIVDEQRAALKDFVGRWTRALAAAEAQPVQEPVACQHKRQKWAINMRTGSCSDCGATFVFGRNGNPESWSPPAALAAAETPTVAQPVAALMRSRSVTTWPHLSVDGKTHYSEWGDWLPTTYKHAKAVTDPSRNADPVCYEMQPLYAAAPPQSVPLTDEQINAIALAPGDYRTFARAIERAHGIGGRS